jgi:uncharacterized alkaline shock family protein YloU
VTALPPVRIRIADLAVARLAAHTALRVPGVLGLHADLASAVSGAAGSLLRTDPARRPPTGARATVADGSAAVALTVVTGSRYNCRELAQAVQREVAAVLAAGTGLDATVTVTIAEIR